MTIMNQIGTMNNGYKEREGKLGYEIDWEFVERMAIRMDSNKTKYEPYNWHKPIDLQELKNALSRHFIAVQKDEYDDDQKYGHLVALACNSMMLIRQLENLNR